MDTVFPEFSGLKPLWEWHYPGRFQFEIEALRCAGIKPVPDADALRKGMLVIEFDWPLDAYTTVRLKAVYPDDFPDFRPQVFLLFGIEPWPVRHVNPTDGNLCLLGRSSHQWVPSLSLYKLLHEKLKDTLCGGGKEDPQGEPADYWWNLLGERGAYCLIDSAWGLRNTRQGILHFRYTLGNNKNEQNVTRINPAPVILGVVSQIYDQDNHLLHEWKASLPPEIQASSKSIHIPWIWLDQPLLPRTEIAQQVEELYKASPWFRKNSKHYQLKRNLSVRFFAIAYPVELTFHQNGVGWTLFMFYGPQQKGQQRISCLPVYRAGLEDIGHRVPAVAQLREKRILVVGTGAVGAPVAIELARNGCQALHLIDPDVVEPGNTIRWPLGTTAWGRPKVEAMKGFLEQNYPATKVYKHSYHLGQVDRPADAPDNLLPNVDLVVDGSASRSVTMFLGKRCRQVGVPLISLFASATLEGGIVVRHTANGGCPHCLEFAWDRNEFAPPPGWCDDEKLTQPPGCAERTFAGAGYDLQELSLQAVRLAVETLSSSEIKNSLVHTLSFLDEHNQRCPPRWRVDILKKQPECFVCNPR